MYDLLNIIVDALFSGSLIFAPCLFFAILFKIPLFSIERITLVRAVNCTMLLGAMLYILGLMIQIYAAVFSGSEYEQYVLADRLIGPYWVIPWFSLIIPHIFLPQIFWVKKFQKSITALLIVACSWIPFFFMTKFFTRGDTWHLETVSTFGHRLVQALAYFVTLSAMYLIIYWKEKRSTGGQSA